MEDVRADDLRGGQREDEQHHEPEERAAADRREPDDEAAAHAERERDLLVAATEHERQVALHAARDEGLDRESDTAGDQRHAEDDRGRVLEAVAVPARKPGREGNPEKRERRRAGEHPESQPRMNRPELPVAHGAEGLEDRSVDDVGADRDGRLEAEEEDEHRRHQRAAAHSGHPDKQPDEEAGDRELRIHPTTLPVAD